MALPIMVRGSGSYGSPSPSLNGGGGGGGGAIIPMAIHTKHNIEYKDVPSSGSIQTATVEGKYFWISFRKRINLSNPQ
ncbi:hypothetical protein BLA29_014474 [Euroglyphus maynei]|uniref:Uncharacterized protein n=1 Tax=Euroglyphus maynei TaxID=6958 RepID=A0A1Y3BK20_EURMA|nr:hypothetical protein BLA29_014474 [Euroglyphus maynei]